MIEKLKTYQSIHYYQLLLALTIFAFCFVQHSITIGVVLLAIYTIYLVIKKEMYFKINVLGIGFFALFIAYMIGVFFSHHEIDALHSLERKLVFLMFPLLFSFRFRQQLNFKPIVIGLISGVIVCSILGLIHSSINYHLHGDFNNSFGASVFSYIHHPTYFSIFLIISFLFAREGMKQKWNYFNVYSVGMVFIFTTIMQFFCFSFAGLIFLFIVIVYLIYKFIWNKFPRIIFIVSLLAFPLIPFVAYHSNIHVQIEVDQAFSDVTEYVYNPKVVLKKEETYSGNHLRLILWTISMEEFSEHPFGIGTSEFDEKIAKRLNDYGLDDIAAQNYNSHNQYLQTAVEIGIFGLLILVVTIFFALFYALKYKNSVLFFLSLNLLFNCLFESILQRESGIVFFGLLLPLLYYWTQIKNKELQTDSN